MNKNTKQLNERFKKLDDKLQFLIIVIIGIIILTAVGGLYENLDKVFVIISFIWLIIKWPLIIIGGLTIIYFIVKFIKWSRNN